MKNKIRLWILRLLGGVDLKEYIKCYNDFLLVTSINAGPNKEILDTKKLVPVTVSVTIDLIMYDGFPNAERILKDGIAHLLAEKLLEGGFILIEQYYDGLIPPGNAEFRGTVLVCRRDS